MLISAYNLTDSLRLTPVTLYRNYLYKYTQFDTMQQMHESHFHKQQTICGIILAPSTRKLDFLISLFALSRL